MGQFFYSIPQRLRDNRLIAYLLLIVFVVVGFTGMGKLRRDDSIESWLGEDSPVIKHQHHFEQVFGNNEDLFIVLEAKDGNIFSRESLIAFHQLHEKLQTFKTEIQNNESSPLAHIQEVVSLVNVPINEVNGDNLYTRPFIGRVVPTQQEELKSMRDKALGDPDLVRRFISANGKYASIALKTDFGRLSETESNQEGMIESTLDFSDIDMEVDQGNIDFAADRKMEKVPRDYQEYADFANAVRNMVKAAGVDDRLVVHYAGLPELIAFFIFIEEENGVIFSGLFLIMAVALGILFRHPSAVIGCMLIPILTVLFTLGFQGWTNLPTSDLTAAMTLLLIIISVADAVHIVAGYKHFRLNGYTHELAIAESMSKAGFSCFLTTLTTMVAFLSLYIVKPNLPAAIFGLFTTLGLAVAFLLSIILIPLLLDVWSPSFGLSKKGNKGEAKTKVKIRILESLSAFVVRRPKFTLALSLAVTSPIVVGIAFLRVDSNPLESFDESTYLRKAFDVADRHMGGTQNIDFMVDMGQVDALYDARVLKTMEGLQNKMLEEFPDLISVSVSIVNILKKINQQLHGNDPAFYKLPEDNGEISQLLFLFNNTSPEERRKLVAEDFDAARISFGLKNGGSTEYVDIVNAANKWGDEFFNHLKGDYPDLDVATAGGVVIFMTLFDNMTDSQILCFLITLLVVILTFFFVFRSWKFGLLAVVPNLTPVLVTFGVMGWLGISLNNVTMILAPIVLGIAVDDTIHFVYKLRVLLARGISIDEAIGKTFTEVGGALTYTTVILSAGMLTLLYSSNADFQAFGYLSAIAFFTGLMADFTVTPALVKLFGLEGKAKTAIDVQVKEGDLHEYTA